MSPIQKRIFQLVVTVLVYGFILFVSAGTLKWAAGWWYLGLTVIMLAGGALALLPAHSGVIEERSRGAKGAKPWDRWLTRLLILPMFGLLIVAGLDEFYGWTPPLPLWARLLGALAFMGGYALTLWAMASNPFFAQVVRIQTERGHTAVTRGPYRLIRHPGYLGGLVSTVGAALVLDSLWGLVVFAVYLILVVIRTALEDRMLQAELPGYSEYARATRWRLLPGLW